MNHKEAAAAAKSLQSCPTLCDSRDGSPLGSPIPGILQARTLEWVAAGFFWTVFSPGNPCMVGWFAQNTVPWTALHLAYLCSGRWPDGLGPSGQT